MGTLELRPLGFGETLDAGFRIYRRSFATLFLAAFLPAVPAVVYWLVAASVVGTSGEAALSLAGSVAIYQGIANVVGWAAVIYLVSRAVQSEGLSIGAAYRRAFRRFLPFAAGLILVGGMMVVGFALLIVPGILLAIMCFAVLAVIIIEGVGPIEAIRRSRHLARGAYARIFGVYLVATLITMLPSGLIWASQGLTDAFQPTVEAGFAAAGPMYAIQQALSLVVGALVMPFSTAVIVLLYFDRRVRVEGLGLDMPDQPVTG